MTIFPRGMNIQNMQGNPQWPPRRGVKGGARGVNKSKRAQKPTPQQRVGGGKPLDMQKMVKIQY
jgi:hypothetical protein